MGELSASGSIHETVEPVQRLPLQIGIVQPESAPVGVMAGILFAGLLLSAWSSLFHQDRFRLPQETPQHR